MTQITNIGALLSIIYLWYNQTNMSLSIRTNNILSSTIVNILQGIPDIVTLILISMLFVLYTRSILLNKRSIMLYIISLLVLEILTRISISMLMLKTSTTCLLFEVHHPMNIENLRIDYFNQEFYSQIAAQQPSMIKDGEAFDYVLNVMITLVDYGKIRTLDANQIQDYASNFVNQMAHTTPPIVEVVHEIIQQAVTLFKAAGLAALAHFFLRLIKTL